MVSKGSHAPSTEQLLTVNEATTYLKCSREFLWKLRKKGEIETVMLGKKVLLPKSSIDNFLQLRSNTDQIKHEITSKVNDAVRMVMANGGYTVITNEAIKAVERCIELANNNQLYTTLPQSTLDNLIHQVNNLITKGGKDA